MIQNDSNPHDPRTDRHGKPVKPPGPLHNNKKEEFCVGMLRGLDILDAYRAAGYGGSSSDIQARKNAHTLKMDPLVKARLFEIQHYGGLNNPLEEAEKNPTITADWVVTETKKLLVKAQQEGELKLARDILVLMGREVGLYKEGKRKATNSDDELKKATLPPPDDGTGQGTIQNILAFVDASSGGNDKASGREDEIIDAEHTEVPPEPEPSE